MSKERPNDAAYNNRDFIPDADTYPLRWKAEADAFRDRLGEGARLGLTYGTQPRDVFDLFLPPTAPRGTLVFVHGGYWRAFDRATWSAFAAGGLAAGCAVAMPSYTLAPEAGIARITTQIAAALSAIAAMTDGPIYLTGHSAGGHLVARMLNGDVALSPSVAERLATCTPISPLADLRPLIETVMNDDFGLDDDAARAESPALQDKTRKVPVHIWVGADERPAFLDQARLLSTAWDAPLTIAPGLHHFNVIDGLKDPGSPLMQTILGT